jgi:hypothetical protein
MVETLSVACSGWTKHFCRRLTNVLAPNPIFPATAVSARLSSLAILCLLLATLHLQAATGNSSGQLTDAQDKRVPGAKVQVTTTSVQKRLRSLHSWLPRRRRPRSPQVIRLTHLNCQELSLTRLAQ